MDFPAELMNIRLERALRWAAVCHEGQTRKGCGAPYAEHLMGVALILDRLGFDEDVVIAGLLHDAVEDTSATLEEVERRFGPNVAELVAYCSEIKNDAQGQKRPWIDRKRDHLETFRHAPENARAVLLADKLHNLVSIELDLLDGLDIWSQFHAGRDDVLWYYHSSIDILAEGSPRLEPLAARCRAIVCEIERY
jgi:(p)ppGpp synthase/HD superfamily hydrolase